MLLYYTSQTGFGRYKVEAVMFYCCLSSGSSLCQRFGEGSLASSSFLRIHLASSGVLKLIIFPNSLAWNTDFTRSFASMRNLLPWTMNGSLVNSSKLYCHSHVSCPNVPFVTNSTPLLVIISISVLLIMTWVKYLYFANLPSSMTQNFRWSQEECSVLFWWSDCLW